MILYLWVQSTYQISASYLAEKCLKMFGQTHTRNGHTKPHVGAAPHHKYGNNNSMANLLFCNFLPKLIFFYLGYEIESAKKVAYFNLFWASKSYMQTLLVFEKLLAEAKYWNSSLNSYATFLVHNQEHVLFVVRNKLHLEYCPSSFVVTLIKLS